MWEDISLNFRSLMRKCNVSSSLLMLYFRLLKGPSYKDKADVINLIDKREEIS